MNDDRHRLFGRHMVEEAGSRAMTGGAMGKRNRKCF
jgi:hypothetical protein